MSLLNLFKISYYFDPVVGYYFAGLWVVVGLLVAILVASIWLGRIVARKKDISGITREFWQGWTGLGYTLSVLGLIYILVRFENLMYVNWRLWPALLILWAAYRSGQLIYLYKKVLPRRAAERANRKAQSYYFRRRRQK